MDRIITAGPLRTFDIYDPFLDRTEGLGNLPTHQIAGEGARDRALASYRRDGKKEFSLLSMIFGTLLKGQPAFFGFRDIENAAGRKLIRMLGAQKRISWSASKYGPSEDDLVLCDLKSFREDMVFLMKYHPPEEGGVFLSFGKKPFDVLDIHWQRRAQVSLKAREDPFHRDLLTFAHGQTCTAYYDSVGTFYLVRRPDLHSDQAVTGLIRKAGEKLQMGMTVAPGLFG